VVASLDRGKKSKRSYRELAREWGLAFQQTPRVVALIWQAWPIGLILMLPLTILIGSLPALSLYFLKRVIDGVSLWLAGNAEAGRPEVILFAVLGFSVLVLQRGLDQILIVLRRVVEARLRHHVQMQIMRHSIGMDMSFFETPSYYDKLQRAQREIGYRPFAVIMSLVQGARDLTTLMGYLVVIVTLGWWLVPYLLLTSLPSLIVQAKFGKKGWMLISGWTPQERLMWYIHSLLTSNRDIKEVRLFALGEHLLDRWQGLFWEYYHKDKRLVRRRALYEFGAVLLGTMAYAGFYAYAIYCTLTMPTVTIGSLILYTQSMERATGSVSAIMRSIATFYENNLYISNLFDFLSQRPMITAPECPVVVPKPLRHGICFEEVCFRYPGATDDALRGVSLEIPAGQRVAIVGENGAGKTTLVKLLARLYDPQGGRITVDGIDLRQFDPSDWQQQIGITFQDFSHYAITARENIGFGRLQHIEDMERIRAAADLSGARECIERMENSWETVLGKTFEEGQELSIGEWQKVALARAFFRDAPILVLDEPTASLDAKQEYEIFLRFNQLTAGKTTVLISHRFSSVRMAERIFVIEKGQVAEQGSHEELMAVNKRYAELFLRQAAAYR